MALILEPLRRRHVLHYGLRSLPARKGVLNPYEEFLVALFQWGLSHFDGQFDGYMTADITAEELQLYAQRVWGLGSWIQGQGHRPCTVQ